jgi:nucleotide-binding universal stress UspA family protein
VEKIEQVILVGVTGPGENTAALRFAAEEAARLGATVCIVHAVHDVIPPPAANPLISYQVPWNEVGNRVVSEAVEEFRALHTGTLEATSVARHGHPVGVFTELSSGASLVVLQHRDLSALHRVFTGSTVAGVAAHAHCPVMSIPPAWTPAHSPGRVTVGVHENGLPASVLAEALAQAALRGWALRVEHAWKLDPAYDDIIMARDHEWRDQAETALRTTLERLTHEHPDVPVEVEVRHQWPADALVELSATSNLLIVGRHSHHALAPRRIGSVARALLRTAECPLMVVPV